MAIKMKFLLGCLLFHQPTYNVYLPSVSDDLYNSILFLILI